MRLLACLVVLAFLPFRFATAQSVQDRIRQVETSLLPYVPVEGMAGWRLEDRMRQHRVPGLSIAVIHNYQIDWVKSYGLADTLTRRPVTNETVFSAGSISKLVAAMAALKLAEQGTLDLDAPVNRYLNSWKLPENDATRKTPVTLRMLLSHRGGTSQSAYFGFTPDRVPLPSVVDILAGKPGTESRPVVVNSEPGKEFRYSGGGYLVAQLAMMDVTGEDFASLTERLIFKPLDLKNTTFRQPLPPALQAKLSGAYSANGWFKGMAYVYPQQAAAGLHTTAADLARIILDLQNSLRGKGTVLNQASAQAMMQPLALVSDGFYREQIGLGAFLLTPRPAADERGRYFNHLGVNAGFIADATASLVGGNGVVVMLNDNNGASELAKEIRRAVAKVYGWTDFLPRPLVARALPDSLLDAYAGRYQRGPDEVVTFRRVGNLLRQTVNNGLEIVCVPVGVDTVAFSDYTMVGYFRRGPSGRIDSVRNEWQKTAAHRLPDGRYLPNELIRMGRIADAVDGYRAMKLNVSQLTYLAYDFTNNRPANLPAAAGILGLAQEQFPKEAIVYARWGEWYEKRGEKSKAIEAYQQVLNLAPADPEAKGKLAELSR